MSPFWLSHHPKEELNRTYRFGSLHVCARCLGTYPVLFALISVQLALRVPLSWDHEVAFAVLLTLPALVDWAVGRFRPGRGSNGVRTLTGVLLGVALGRTLYVHLHRPMPPALVIQLALVLTVAAPVLLLGRHRARQD